MNEFVIDFRRRLSPLMNVLPMADGEEVAQRRPPGRAEAEDHSGLYSIFFGELVNGR